MQNTQLGEFFLCIQPCSGHAKQASFLLADAQGRTRSDGSWEWWRCVCVSKIRCSKTNTSIMTACTCLYSPHKKSRQRYRDGAIAASLLKKRAANQKVSHDTLFTQDKLSISNSTEWLVVPYSGVPGKPKTPKKTRGNLTQISNVSLLAKVH